MNPRDLAISNEPKGTDDGDVFREKGHGAGRRQRFQHRLGDYPQAARRGGGSRLHPSARRQDGTAGAEAGRACRRQADHLVRRPEGRGRRTGLRGSQADLRIARFRPPLDRLRPARRPEVRVRRLQPRGLQDGDGRQRLLAGRRRPPRGPRHDRRRLDPHAHLLRRRKGRPRLQHDGGLQGRARRLGQVPRLRPRPQENSGQRPLGRAGEDARRVGRRRFRPARGTVRGGRPHAAERHPRGSRRIGHVPAVGPRLRDQR